VALEKYSLFLSFAWTNIDKVLSSKVRPGVIVTVQAIISKQA